MLAICVVVHLVVNLSASNRNGIGKRTIGLPAFPGEARDLTIDQVLIQKQEKCVGGAG